MLCGAVGAPHVAGVGGLGGPCWDLMFLGGIGTDELSLFCKEVRVAGERSDAIESVSRRWHGGWCNRYALYGAIGAGWVGWCRDHWHDGSCSWGLFG